MEAVVQMEKQAPWGACSSWTWLVANALTSPGVKVVVCKKEHISIGHF
jgi:hypothetical protein